MRRHSTRDHPCAHKRSLTKKKVSCKVYLEQIHPCFLCTMCSLKRLVLQVIKTETDTVIPLPTYEIIRQKA